jgi:hypothetical protein
MSRRFYTGWWDDGVWVENSTADERKWTRMGAGRAAFPARPFFLAAQLATPILAVCPFSPSIPNFTSGEGILAPDASVAVYDKAP